jgi:hypothetical protein
VDILEVQAGVVSRRQLHEAGYADHDTRRLVRRRHLTSVHRGVYVDHTGDVTWEQRAWAAVLAVWPAALCGVSAMRAFEGSGGHEHTIHVAVDLRRNVRPPRGVVIHRRARLDQSVAWNLAPPRTGWEESVIDVAAEQKRDIDAVAVLANAVGSRRTTADRLRGTLDSRARVRRRSWMERVLRDIDAGTWSVLEHGYLDLVERPHALPSGRRQVLHVGPAGRQYRDVDVDGLTVIELDGRLHHGSSRQRDRDLERDLDVALEGRRTLRLGWGQVFGRPCVTAAKVGAILKHSGWDGHPVPCGPDCTLPATKSRVPVTT